MYPYTNAYSNTFSNNNCPLNSTVMANKMKKTNINIAIKGIKYTNSNNNNS